MEDSKTDIALSYKPHVINNASVSVSLMDFMFKNKQAISCVERTWHVVVAHLLLSKMAQVMFKKFDLVYVHSFFSSLFID